MPENFRGLTLTPDDYWAPLSTLGPVRGTPRERQAAAGIVVVGRLKRGLSRQAAVAQLQAWDVGRPGRNRTEPGGSRLTLVPRQGTVERPFEAVPVTAPLFFAFGLILLTGCANVANLLLARGVARQREIGIQLSIGATRRRIVRQLLTESLLLSLVAAVAGFAISRVVLAVTINAVMSSMPPDIGDIRLLMPAADWRVLLFLVVGAGVSTIAFALAPALQATTIEPIRTIRGEVVSETRPRRARNVLIALQVSASALLLICAGVFLRSAMASAAFDPGIRTADTVAIQVDDEPRRKAIVQAVTAEPSVSEVAAWLLDPVPRTAIAASGDASEKIAYTFVSPEFFSVLDISLMRGRTFTSVERSPSLALAVVSDTTARALWPNADAIGQVMRLDPDLTIASGGAGEPPFESRTVAIVGVVRDVAGFRVTPFNKAVVYVPASVETTSTSLVARVHGDPELARQALLDRLTAIDPNLARGVATMRTLARMDTIFLQLAFGLTIVLGGLALVMTLSGLFSVLSYVVAQRTGEIGVRMALGATTRDVARMILRQSMRPVGAGLLIGGGSAAGLAGLLLATPAAASIGEAVHVLDPIAYAVSLGIIIAACLAAASIPAARAARVDPARTLRQN